MIHSRRFLGAPPGNNVSQRPFRPAATHTPSTYCNPDLCAGPSLIVLRSSVETQRPAGPSFRSYFFEPRRTSLMMSSMRRANSLQQSLARLLVVVAFLAQFAPSIHASAPHPHESSSCTHAARIHLEASTSDGKDTPCFVCSHLTNRQAPAVLPFVVCELVVAIAPKQPPLVVCGDGQAVHHPDDRGPPHSL